MLVDNGDQTDPANTGPGEPVCLNPHPEKCTGLIGFEDADVVRRCPKHRPKPAGRSNKPRRRRPVPAR